MANEQARFEYIQNFRVEAVEQNYFKRPEPLYYQHRDVEPCVQYDVGNFKDEEFQTVEEVLDAVRMLLDGS